VSPLLPHNEDRPGLPEPLQRQFALPVPKRADLHCHSEASTRTGERMLDVIRCPESFSPPEQIIAQAKHRGMDFVTITDHDSIEGVLKIADRPFVIVGEELTCWFPEDLCKMHVLVYGINREQHERLQAVAKDIYKVADIIERENIAHSVAHPIYRQNDRLERWHVERLLLLFKGFECLNGAHAPTHRAAFEPVLDRLNRAEIARLSEVHNLKPRWPEPWFKSRTAGSDDHGLLNIGRTFTEFPPEVKTVDDVLTCLREGSCRPAGEAGSTLKLAHTFYSVAVRYNERQHRRHGKKSGLATVLMQAFVGQRKPPSKLELAGIVVRSKLKKLRKRIPLLRGPKRDRGQSDGLLRGLFLDSIRKHFPDHPELLDVMKSGMPALSEHEDVFKLVQKINRDLSDGVANFLAGSAKRGAVLDLFDGVSAALAQQFLLAPYYFALFHQNKERHLLGKITRMETLPTAQSIKVGLFTDTFDDMNGVSRFIRDMGEHARRENFHLTVHTCTGDPKFDLPNRRNFKPLLSRPMPYYQNLQLNVPPLLEMLELADREQYDVIHVSTPGPVGMVGYLASKMLRVPMLSTYHTDFPAYVAQLTGDYRMTTVCESFMSWFYQRAAAVFSRSVAYHFNLRELGVEDERLRTITPGINTDKFNPKHRDALVWSQYGVAPKAHKLLYVGRISVEKNLPLLVKAFRELAARRGDVHLVIAGEGPYEEQMKKELAGQPVTFCGARNDAQLGPLYASSDLFVFPSRTDTLGQVVMEAQASGLPTLVSTEGGPREIIDPDRSGLVLSATESTPWVDAIDKLLNDPARREQMSQAALFRAQRYSLRNSFLDFWNEHLSAIMPEPHEAIAPPPSFKRNRFMKVN
jgi:glycosyltransferase involved in cell wall biosynthesis